MKLADDLPRLLTRADFDSDEEYEEYLLIENADYGPVESLSDEERQRWKQMADATVSGERARISIAIPKRNLSRLKARALEEGMPYQTLINSILHRWLSGR